MDHTFNAERACPLCSAKFAKAERKTEFDPVVVVVCPGCKQLLWLPGSDENAKLWKYDPNQDAGGL